MANVFDALPPESAAVIVDELTRHDPALLAALRDAQEPSTAQRAAVERLLASAVVKGLGPDWTPSEHGFAVERAVKVFLEVWPLYR